MGEVTSVNFSRRPVKVALILLLLAVSVISIWGFKFAFAKDTEVNTITVMAASSLTDTFQELAGEFETTRPGVRVQLNFAGTQSLRAQLEQGAAADIFAAANYRHIQALYEQGLVTKPAVFAENRLILLVPKGNPAGITSIFDLSKPHRLVWGGDGVPVGMYSRQLLKNVEKEVKNFERRVEANVVSEETSARSVLTKVALGEADAGLVYATDVNSDWSEKVEAIDIPQRFNPIIRYYISKVLHEGSQELGKQFTDYMFSVQGGKKLREYGFQPVER